MWKHYIGMSLTLWHNTKQELFIHKTKLHFQTPRNGMDDLFIFSVSGNPDIFSLKIPPLPAL